MKNAYLLEKDIDYYINFIIGRMREKNITMTELARLCGVSYLKLYRILKKKFVNAKELKRIYKLCKTL